MSEHSDPREQVEASAEQQELELKDLAVQSEGADQVRGGGTTLPATKPAPKGSSSFEIKDFSFGVENG